MSSSLPMRSMLSWCLSGTIAGVGQLRKKMTFELPLPLKLYRKTQVPHTIVCIKLFSCVTCVKDIGCSLSLCITSAHALLVLANTPAGGTCCAAEGMTCLH